MKANKQNFANAFLAMSLAVATFSGAFANDESYLNSDPININGYVQEAAPVTDHELETVKNELNKQKNAIVVNKEKKKKYNELSRSTEKLADVTEDMIEERKESQVTIDKFNKKIDCLMAEGQKEGCEEYVKTPKQDTVAVQQAAPVAQVVEAPIAEAKTSNIKVLPYSGITTMFTDNEQLEAGLVGGVKVETDVSSRFSVGIGFNYTSLTTNDFASNSGYFGNNTGYYDYYNSYYGGREIDYKNMNFNIYSKFFIIKNDRFRPYVGAGLGYNRTTLAYGNNNVPSTSYGMYSTAYSPYAFGQEEVVTSSINAELMVGSEIKFTDSIGANLELNYIRAMGNRLSSQNKNFSFAAPDQLRLEDLSNELSEANVISLFVGVLVEF